MRNAIFISVLLLTFSIGCTGKESLIDQSDFLEQFKTSLKAQGFDVETMEPSSSVDMEGNVPFQYSISQNGKDNDIVFIYFFNSANQANQALKKASFTITSLTKIGKYQKNNIIVIHYALDGDLDKYKSHIYKAMRKE